MEYSNYYTSITELPVWNWDKYLATNDYNYLLKNNDLKLEIEMSELSDKLTSELIDEFGISTALENKLSIKRNILNYQIEILKGNKTLQTRLNAEIDKLNKIIEEESKFKQSIGKKAAILSSFFKMQVNVKQISVYDFMHLLNIYNEQNKPNKK